MRKKKRRPNLPRGFGSIKKLSGNRRNPYGVYPPVKDWNDHGSPITGSALAYVDTWQKGFVVLSAYHAGTYTPGMELTFADQEEIPEMDPIIQRLLADYRRIKGLPVPEDVPTFGEVFDRWYQWKFVEDKSRTYSKSIKRITLAARAALSALEDKPFKDLKRTDLQQVLNTLSLGHDTVTRYLTVLKQVSRYAEMEGIIDKDETMYLRVTQADTKKARTAISEAKIRQLWDLARTNDDAALIVILCYTGLRISEAATLDIDLKNDTLRGGTKTDAGKNRLIPIHPGIKDLIERIRCDNGLYSISTSAISIHIKAVFDSIGLTGYSPHYCRHTFATMCEKYDVRDVDAKRMMGHTIGDITKGVYSHRAIEDLRKQICKIPSPGDL